MARSCKFQMRLPSSWVNKSAKTITGIDAFLIQGIVYSGVRAGYINKKAAVISGGFLFALQL